MPDPTPWITRIATGTPIATLVAVAALVAAVATASSAATCPTDLAPRATTTLLVVQPSGAATQALGPAELDALPVSTLTQRQSVTGGAGGAGGSERSTVLAGVLLRDLLAHAGFGGPADRGARLAMVEAVATDGYRALFSWGELFNSDIGAQALVIRSQDGQPLDAVAGPLALRSLADLRPGPRHVRNLCAVRVLRAAA
jgi:hypothetical protein